MSAGRPQQREELIDRLGREAFISLFVTANRFNGDIERLCKGENLAHGQYSILWVLCLSDTPGGVPLRDLADGLLHRSSDVSRLVERLHSVGLVTRHPSVADRRLTLIAPTAKGREVFDRLTLEIKALHRHHWSSLDQDELRQLTYLLNKALWREKFGTFDELPS